MMKYEDLVISPVSTLVNLYSKFSLDYDITTADALYKHTNASKKFVNSLNHYYSTYKTADDNDIFKWKKGLSLKQIRHVEKNCDKFMQKVGYTVFPVSDDFLL